MKESAVTFGASGNLAGVVTDPDPTCRRAELPAVLFLNAGLLHKVGPFRWYVALARTLAGLGYTCLRFDQGGLGDSELARAEGSDAERAVLDIREAMDLLERRRGARRFVLIGLCSGADGAHPAAVRDPRVAGMVQLDGYGYRTFRFHLERLGSRLVSANSWRMLWWRARGRLPPQSRPEIFTRTFAPRELVEREIQALVDRGAELLYVYTGGVSHYYRYPRQFVEMFPRLRPQGRIATEYFPLADHTYTFGEDRRRLFETVVRWLETRRWTGGSP